MRLQSMSGDIVSPRSYPAINFLQHAYCKRTAAFRKQFALKDIRPIFFDEIDDMQLNVEAFANRSSIDKILRLWTRILLFCSIPINLRITSFLNKQILKTLPHHMHSDNMIILPL